MSDQKIRGSPPVLYGPVLDAWIALRGEIRRPVKDTVIFKKEEFGETRRLTVYSFGRFCAVVERGSSSVIPKAFRKWNQSLRKVKETLCEQGWEVAK